MKNIFIIFLSVLTLGLYSCEGNDIENNREEILVGGKFEPITIETVGLNLKATADEFTLEGNIPAEGLSFSIIPSKKYRQAASVSRILINGVKQYKENNFSGEPPYLEEIPVLNGDWGNIQHNNSTHSIEIDIKKNNADTPRVFDLVLGGGYKYLNLRLVQQAAPTK